MNYYILYIVLNSIVMLLESFESHLHTIRLLKHFKWTKIYSEKKNQTSKIINETEFEYRIFKKKNRYVVDV